MDRRKRTWVVGGIRRAVMKFLEVAWGRERVVQRAVRAVWYWTFSVTRESYPPGEGTEGVSRWFSVGELHGHGGLPAMTSLAFERSSGLNPAKARIASSMFFFRSKRLMLRTIFRPPSPSPSYFSPSFISILVAFPLAVSTHG